MKLDKFKKGNEMINYHAREFTRELDKIAGDNLFNGGISLGKGRGKLRLKPENPFLPKWSILSPIKILIIGYWQ